MENSVTFFDFLADYWWLVFPLAYFIGAGWDSWMKYQRHKADLDLLKSYATSGNEPPAGLIKALDRSSTAKESGMYAEDDKSWGGTSFLVILFVGLASIFAYAGYTGMLGLGEEAYFVAMILGVLAVAFLAGGLFAPRGKSK